MKYIYNTHKNTHALIDKREYTCRLHHFFVSGYTCPNFTDTIIKKNYFISAVNIKCVHVCVEYRSDFMV